ncbi:type II secretion system protein [Rubellicoccus peritrichatus]|uniref:Type II secretion system protein n=1 Tax=Rubellicoccus peritrichatus TaxID=3080537 RepID=A0AAQ3QVE1_9BACT|nr:type II secretion system protein [Puniceicoccus sp. CR14]WOO40712.1 type II secretion system protein [Puniceicoccus sp. CR14]
MRTRSRQNGFTLVELLTAIAVVAVLGAILVPVLSSSRTKTELVQSTSNVRQIGVAALTFAQDNDGELPVWHDYRDGIQQYWWQILRPYAGSDNNIFGSPAHEEFDPTNDGTVAATISYGWNYVVMGRHKGDSAFDGDHVGTQWLYPNPSETLVLTDGPKTDSWGYIDHTGHSADPERYDGKTVALFLDGRAEVKPVETFLVEDPYFLSPKDLPGSN